MRAHSTRPPARCAGAMPMQARVAVVAESEGSDCWVRLVPCTVERTSNALLIVSNDPLFVSVSGVRRGVCQRGVARCDGALTVHRPKQDERSGNRQSLVGPDDDDAQHARGSRPRLAAGRRERRVVYADIRACEPVDADAIGSDFAFQVDDGRGIVYVAVDSEAEAQNCLAAIRAAMPASIHSLATHYHSGMFVREWTCCHDMDAQIIGCKHTLPFADCAPAHAARMPSARPR